MLKLTSLALGLLTIISLVPTSEAMAANSVPVTIERPAANLHSQVIFKIGDRNRSYSRRTVLQRRRELQRQREAARRRAQYRGRRDRYNGNYRLYR